MQTALERAIAKTESIPSFNASGFFTYDAPVSDRTIREWQAQLDHEFYRSERRSRLLVRWEPGDPWQPIGRFFLFQGVDPRVVKIEPWVRKALNGPSPRSTGHICWPGFCPCEMKRNRWEGGAAKHIDTQQWRIHRETGLYATRWWVIQGDHGGHRYQWETDELQSLIAQMKTGDRQPPAAGNLEYAPFSLKVIEAVRQERIIAGAAQLLDDLHERKDGLRKEEREVAMQIRRELMAWIDTQAESLWGEGAELLPRYFEEKYGRAPVGHKITTDYEQEEQEFLMTGVE